MFIHPFGFLPVITWLGTWWSIVSSHLITHEETDCLFTIWVTKPSPIQSIEYLPSSIALLCVVSLFCTQEEPIHYNEVCYSSHVVPDNLKPDPHSRSWSAQSAATWKEKHRVHAGCRWQAMEMQDTLRYSPVCFSGPEVLKPFGEWCPGSWVVIIDDTLSPIHR